MRLILGRLEQQPFMKELLLGVLIGLIIGWATVPGVHSRVKRKVNSYLEGLNQIIVLLEKIEVNTQQH